MINHWNEKTQDFTHRTILGIGHTWWRQTYEVELMYTLSPKVSMTNHLKATLYGVKRWTKGGCLRMAQGPKDPWISCPKRIPISHIIIPLHGSPSFVFWF